MAEYTIHIDDDYDSPAVRQELARATELVLQSARERFYAKAQVLRRGYGGYDGDAVARSADLALKQQEAHDAAFGRPRS
jgi:hypothetical protein